MIPPLHRLLATALALALGTLAGPASAERADRDKPTLLEGEQCVSEELKQLYVCTGKVQLVRGTLRITGERMEVRQDPEGYRTAVVTAAPGERATFRQRRDETRPGVEEWMEGYAERIEYDERSENLRFIERAQWKRLENGQPRDEVAGRLITYNNLSSTYNVDGGKAQGGDGRVRLILAPQERPAGAGTKPAPAPLKPDNRLDGAPDAKK
jgi:lipopolysaccharide export system protein LptA